MIKADTKGRVPLTILDIEKIEEIIERQQIRPTRSGQKKKNTRERTFPPKKLVIFRFSILFAKKNIEGEIYRVKDWIPDIRELGEEDTQIDMLKAFKGILDRAKNTSLHQFAGN